MVSSRLNIACVVLSKILNLISLIFLVYRVILSLIIGGRGCIDLSSTGPYLRIPVKLGYRFISENKGEGGDVGELLHKINEREG